jgi:predicted transcriptional regulator of viral defense system
MYTLLHCIPKLIGLLLQAVVGFVSDPYHGIYTMIKGTGCLMMVQERYKNIRQFFRQLEVGVYKERELLGLYKLNRYEWGLPRGWNFTNDFLPVMLQEGVLKLVEFEHFRGPVKRYYLGSLSSPPVFALATSLKTGCYLSHSTAVYIHSLSTLIPKTVYFNKEQPSKPSPDGDLTQEALDRAFSHEQRTSSSIFTAPEFRVVELNGKNTGNLGTTTFQTESGPVLVTGVDRTLIDIAVRPAYAGGPSQVLTAYRAAIKRVSVRALYSTLKRLNYRYPYQQVVGFYLQQAGLSLNLLKPFLAGVTDLKFYLDYNLEEKSLDPTWNLYVPKGLAATR